MSAKIIVLISGGNANIGYEIVKKLAWENPDTHHVMMGTRDLDKGEEAWKSMGSPSNVTPIELDITKDPIVDQAFENIKSIHGKLDILIHNAGTAGRDMGEVEGGAFLARGVSIREVYKHVYDVNVISAAVMTEKMIPLLEKSALPKIIFISSGLGSIAKFQDGYTFVDAPWYNSSKSAVNYLSAFYARKYPTWKVNACCPGLNATGLNAVPMSEATHPRNGAINACKLALEGQDGASGTYTNTEGTIPW